MNLRFARRIAGLATLQISVASIALVLAVALFAFGASVRAISSGLSSTLIRLDRVIAQSAATDATAASAVIATQVERADVVVVVVDPQRRVTIFHAREGELPAVVTRTRGDTSADPVASGPLARPILGLATAFGLQQEHQTVGPLTIIVKENEAILVAQVASYLAELGLVVIVAVLVAHVIARVLTRQTLRPLVDVIAALERFAAGDLTPQPIAADERQEFGALAVAYNGAIAQMERAFAERDRAGTAMRQFIADAGHQLKTPLTVMRGFIAVLRKGDLRSPADREHILETMNRQSQIMASLIEKLIMLDAWDREGPPPSSAPIDVGQLVGDVVTPIADARTDRTLRIHADAGLLAAIDPSDLAQIVTNLVDNALKYTAGEIAVSVRADGDRVLVEVADAGPGMDADEAAKVFDRFYRGARRDVDGSGLGLAIAKRAVERSGGSLTLRSDPERGSTFAVTLIACRTTEAR